MEPSMKKQHKEYNMAFANFCILNLNFNSNKNISLTKKEVPINTTIGMKHDYLKEKKELHVYLRVELKDEKMPFCFTVESKGVFLFKKTPTKATLNNITKINCPAIIFPYVRETIADITRRAGFAPLHLDPVNFVALAEQQESKTTKKQRTIKK